MAAQRILQGLAPVGRVVVRARKHGSTRRCRPRGTVRVRRVGARHGRSRRVQRLGGARRGGRRGPAVRPRQQAQREARRRGARGAREPERRRGPGLRRDHAGGGRRGRRRPWPPGRAPSQRCGGWRSPPSRRTSPVRRSPGAASCASSASTLAAAKAALAVEHYEEAAGVEKPTEPEPEEARPESASRWA